MRFLPVSLTTLLVELADLDQTLALFASLDGQPLAGIEELIPAARTLMIRYRPEQVTPETIAAEIMQRDLSQRVARNDTLVEIPVHYDGEDLVDVAELIGLAVDDVIRLHTQSEFTVAFCGFAPGFGYLVGGSEVLHVPRRKTPRTRIPAGSVAIAGAFSGVYPQASPGGWQIIGTTPLKMWDLGRDPPALFQPGYRVRFVDMARGATTQILADKVRKTVRSKAAGLSTGQALEVLSAPIPALFQDLGRFGQTGQGVSASGALDKAALKAANRAVGNPTHLPCLEITLGSFSFRSLGRSVIALTGAPCPISITDAAGRSIAAPIYQPVALEPGDVVQFDQPKQGMRSYLAVRGGFVVEPVLGSASTDTLAVVGPDPVVPGTILAICEKPRAITTVSLDEVEAFPCPTSSDIVTLDIVMGPRTDWFTAKGVATLTNQLWQVTPQSSRVGIRLAGETAIERRNTDELASEGTATGAIQVPHNGHPVLFLADHPLTGGYPVIGTVAEYHLDLAGQIPVNGRIRFRPLSPFGEIEPAASTMTKR